MTKIAFSKAKKIAMKFFGSEITPPFGNFPEIHPFWYARASLMLNVGPQDTQVKSYVTMSHLLLSLSVVMKRSSGTLIASSCQIFQVYQKHFLAF